MLALRVRGIGGAGIGGGGTSLTEPDSHCGRGSVALRFRSMVSSSWQPLARAAGVDVRANNSFERTAGDVCGSLRSAARVWAAAQLMIR